MLVPACGERSSKGLAARSAAALGLGLLPAPAALGRARMSQGRVRMARYSIQGPVIRLCWRLPSLRCEAASQDVSGKPSVKELQVDASWHPLAVLPEIKRCF